MRTYCPKHNKLHDIELRVRKIVQHYVLVAANCGLRIGEQRQLRWKDVHLERHSANGTEQRLARVHERAETSEMRTNRIFLCRNGQYFEHLRDFVKPKNGGELMFTIDGETQIIQRKMLYHWQKMIELAEIDDRETRDLVLYSLHHFMITQRILSRLTFMQTADMCGKSVPQIEKTYYHLNEKIR